jgi:hypothetical protein
MTNAPEIEVLERPTWKRRLQHLARRMSSDACPIVAALLHKSGLKTKAVV